MVSVTHEEREALIAEAADWLAVYEDLGHIDVLRRMRKLRDALVSVQAERDAYAAKLSAIHEKLSTPLDESKVLDTPEGRALWHAVLAGQVRVILAQVNAADLLGARDDENRAQGWDEGRQSVALDMIKSLGEDGQRPATPNPYRKAGEK